MSAVGAPFAALDRRQPLLARFGLLLLACALATAALQFLDPRSFGDRPTWAKPTRFFLSLGVFALTAAWFVGDVAEPWRRGRAMRWTARALVVTAGYEGFYIAYRAAWAEGSHFNFATPWTSAGYALMGVGAVVLVATALPIAWAVARHPRAGLSAHYRLAVVTGLVLTTVLGGGLGGYMSSAGAHSVGAVGGAVPVTGWNRAGGDLRVAHFLGLHAEHILPLAAVMIGAVLSRGRRAAVAAVAVVLVAVTLATFAQALAGRPLI